MVALTTGFEYTETDTKVPASDSTAGSVTATIPPPSSSSLPTSLHPSSSPSLPFCSGTARGGSSARCSPEGPRGSPSLCTTEAGKEPDTAIDNGGTDAESSQNTALE